MRRVVVLLPAALVLAACGGNGAGSGGSSEPTIQTIQISEKEYSLNPSTITLPKPGRYAFEVTNDGTVTHALTIEAGDGMGEEAASGDIEPGSKKTVEYTFSPGTSYEMYCPIDGHKAQGMVGAIRVRGAPGGGTTTNDEGETTTGETSTSSNPGY
jgi:plastocyanin